MELAKGKAGAAAGGKLLLCSLLDSKDELEERLERCVGIVTSLTSGLSEREANDALNAHICKGTPQHEEICLGLFTLVLTDPAQAQKCYRDLALVSRDGMNIVLNKINHILMEKYLKLQDTCRSQLVWLLRELVKSGVLGADGVCMTFMKQIAGGDVTAKNIWLAENVLEILTEQREWVLKSSLLVAMAVYTYLRLIVDHHGTAALQALRQKEVDFCVSLLRERFMDCFMIGRDLVRLLQNVARIPEFEQLWKDILHNPQVLSSQFTGVLQLLQSRTSRKFLACRLTPDMETKLLFMTSRVRFGQQKRYQDWFQRQYLSTPDSQSLRCDLIRYICGVVHPSNEVLSSDILPRWAIIGWLLTTCTVSPKTADPCPVPRRHLAPLFDNPKLDKELRAMLREKFPEFCSSPSPPIEVKIEEPVPMEMENHLEKDDGCYDNAEAAFSDDEEELSSKGKKREFRFHPIKESIVEEPVDITPFLEQLDESLRDKVLQLQKGSDTEAQCEVMQEIVDQVLEEDFDSEQLSVLASCLQELFKAHFRGEVLPEEITEESLEESVGKPLYLIFRNLCQMQEDNSGFSLLLDLLSELYQKQPKIGYHLLYYLRASKAALGRMGLYESFAQATQLGELHTCLMMDMKACQEDDVRLLCFLTPSIYTEPPTPAAIPGVLLAFFPLDPDPIPCPPPQSQLQELVCHVMMGNLVMFRKDSVLNILIQSLDWETFEQYCTWQLFLAHNIPLETIIPILQHLKYRGQRGDGAGTALRSSSSKLAQLTLEQILEHLDNLRLNLTNTKQNFFSQTPILQALQHVQASCDEAHKMKFSDLFSLAEEYEDSSSKPPKSRRKATALASPRSRKSAAQPPNNEEESGSSSASEEEDTKPKPAKRKRKGSSAVGSDSD
uniref:integrator complex subunit 3 n=1 Tax=Lonchura striata TaxID=40157 RepID=UPI0012941453|nr:integrator complex subunit 3 [Lonchura striata domestica]